jgi:hypothetical protein
MQQRSRGLLRAGGPAIGCGSLRCGAVRSRGALPDSAVLRDNPGRLRGAAQRPERAGDRLCVGVERGQHRAAALGRVRRSWARGGQRGLARSWVGFLAAAAILALGGSAWAAGLGVPGQPAQEPVEDLAQNPAGAPEIRLAWRLPRPAPFVGERTRVEIELELEDGWRQAHLAELLARPLDLSVQLELAPLAGAPSLRRLEPTGGPTLSLAFGDEELRAAAEAGSAFLPRPSTRLLLPFELVPGAAGTLRLPPLALELATARGFETDFLGRRQPIGLERRRMDAPGAELSVRALPPGAPADFCGLVGRFEFSAEAAPTTLAAGESLLLALEVSGDGDLGALALPDWAAQPGWGAFHGLGALLIEAGPDRRRLELEFEPLTAGVPELPPLSLCWFDPLAERYERWASPPMALLWPDLPAPGAEAPGATPAGPAAAPGSRAPGVARGPGPGVGSGEAPAATGAPAAQPSAGPSGPAEAPGAGDAAGAAAPRPDWPLWAAGLLGLVGVAALLIDRRSGSGAGAQQASGAGGDRAGLPGGAPGASTGAGARPFSSRGPAGRAGAAATPAGRASLQQAPASAGASPGQLGPRSNGPAARAGARAWDPGPGSGRSGAPGAGPPAVRSSEPPSAADPEAALRVRLAAWLGSPEAELFAPGLAARLSAAGLAPDVAREAAARFWALTAARYGGPPAAFDAAELAGWLARLPEPPGQRG